jgi:hypothetical protein
VGYYVKITIQQNLYKESQVGTNQNTVCGVGINNGNMQQLVMKIGVDVVYSDNNTVESKDVLLCESCNSTNDVHDISCDDTSQNSGCEIESIREHIQQQDTEGSKNSKNDAHFESRDKRNQTSVLEIDSIEAYMQQQDTEENENLTKDLHYDSRGSINQKLSFRIDSIEKSMQQKDTEDTDYSANDALYENRDDTNQTSSFEIDRIEESVQQQGTEENDNLTVGLNFESHNGTHRNISFGIDSIGENIQQQIMEADIHIAANRNPVISAATNSLDAHNIVNKERVGRYRKRKREPVKWKTNIKCQLVNSGQEYVTKSGHTVLAKSLQLPPQCCKKKCVENIAEVDCQRIHNAFWNLSDHKAQSFFIVSCLLQKPVKVHIVNNAATSKKSRPKQFSRQYCLPVNDQYIPVCKLVFCAVLCINSSRIDYLMNQQRRTGGMPPSDGRGKYDHSKQRVSPNKLRIVEEHIKSIPTCESHYTRNHSDTKRYIASDLSIPKLYELYTANCQQIDSIPVKQWLYRHVFDTKFNLSAKVPYKDTCKKCDLYKAEINYCTTSERKKELEREHEVHLRKAEAAKVYLKKEMNQHDSSRESFTFDLQKVMSFPQLTTNEVYYSRQLSVYNLGIHSLNKGLGIMHVWPEHIASRGPEEISSCLLNYCQQRAAEGVRHITAFSDTCGGQNRNYKVVLMWMYLCSTTDITKVDHKFMVPGHSFLPNDSDFGVIERATKKAADLYVPDQWYKVISKSNRKNPFQIVEMTPEKFVSVNNIDDCTTIRKHSLTGEKVEWMRIQWIQIRKEEPLKMFYKYTLQNDEEFSCSNFQRRGRPITIPQNLQQLYQQQRLLSVEKVCDIKKLLKYIPPIHHGYYLALQSSSTETEEVENDMDQEVDMETLNHSSTPQSDNTNGALLSCRSSIATTTKQSSTRSRSSTGTSTKQSVSASSSSSRSSIALSAKQSASIKSTGSRKTKVIVIFN